MHKRVRTYVRACTRVRACTLCGVVLYGMALQGMVCVCGWVGSLEAGWCVGLGANVRVGGYVCVREGCGRKGWGGHGWCKGFGSEHGDVGLDACWVCGVRASIGEVCWLVAGWRVAGWRVVVGPRLTQHWPTVDPLLTHH